MKNYVSQFEETIICKIIANLSEITMLSFLPYFSLFFSSAVFVTLLEKKIPKSLRGKRKLALAYNAILIYFISVMLMHFNIFLEV